MDFIGDFGYLYMLQYNEDTGCYISTALSTLIIPSHVANLKALNTTSDYMFKMKNFLQRMTKTVNKVLFNQQINNILPTLDCPSLAANSNARRPTSIIFWVPKRTNNTE
ncbi:hypothetical protein DFQ30_001991 [Apophysomyces sp. BC1015]|nr:hypothetical protein DFQ30_001991 [Apophysomyces sp. BC1015]KAG0179294.1 hypothetical protein DFQ29_002296 [Apophysomyces sp. BC1021]